MSDRQTLNEQVFGDGLPMPPPHLCCCGTSAIGRASYKRQVASERAGSAAAPPSAASAGCVSVEEKKMACPICDQKPMNCDCTPRERAMWRELHGDPQPAQPLTSEELDALWFAIGYAQNGGNATVEAALRGLLERLQ